MGFDCINSRSLPVALFLSASISGITEICLRCSSFCATMDAWMDDLRFYVLFNSISVISERCLDENGRLCAMELRLWL